MKLYILILTLLLSLTSIATYEYSYDQIESTIRVHAQMGKIVLKGNLDEILSFQLIDNKDDSCSLEFNLISDIGFGKQVALECSSDIKEEDFLLLLKNISCQVSEI